MGRMSDLESVSRDRLKLTGAVTLVPVPRSQLVQQGLATNPAVTSTSDDMKHTIKYVAYTKLEDHMFFHEFSRAKLDEIGFRKVEKLVEERAAKCPSSEFEVSQMRVVLILVAETLVDEILYRSFRKETEDLRNELDYSFLMTANLRTIERKLGLQGIIQAAGYRVSKKQAGLGESFALGRAVHEAFRDGETAAYYDRSFRVLSGLPQVGGPDGIRELDDAEVGRIADSVLALYEILTGKKCA